MEEIHSEEESESWCFICGFPPDGCHGDDLSSSIKFASKQDQFCSSLSSKQDLIFILLKVFEIPWNQLEKYFSGDAEDGSVDVKLCEDCWVAAYQARAIYGNLISSSEKYRGIQRKLLDKIKRTGTTSKLAGLKLKTTTTEGVTSKGPVNSIDLFQDTRRFFLKNDYEDFSSPVMIEDLGSLWKHFTPDTPDKDPPDDAGVVPKDEVESEEEKSESDQDYFMEEGGNEPELDEMSETGGETEFQKSGMDGEIKVQKSAKNSNEDHSQQSVAKTTYICPLCPKKSFKSKGGFSTHQKRVHGTHTAAEETSDSDPHGILQKEKVQCPLCPNKYTQIGTIRRHIKLDHGGQKVTMPKDKFICRCGKTYTKIENLRVHIDQMRGEPRHKCEVCSELFYKDSHLVRHKQIKHSNEAFVCEHCGVEFSCADYLYCHRNKVHPSNSTSSNQSIKKNEGMSRGSKKLDPSISSDKWWMRSKRSEYGTAPAHGGTCHLCGKFLKTGVSLHQHIRIIHERKYKKYCEICGHGTYNKLMLKIHKQRYHKDVMVGAEGEDIECFQCTVSGCRKVYQSKISLENHVKREHGESGNYRKYQCAFCVKRFCQRYKLKEHENNIHKNPGQRPFKCEICGKGFTTRGNMRYHQRHTHKKEARNAEEDNSVQ